MKAIKSLHLSPASTPPRVHGPLSTAEYTWLLFLFLPTAHQAFAIVIPGNTALPTADQFSYNGTYGTSKCLSKFACSTAVENVPECSCHQKCAVFDECCEDVRPPNWRQLQLPPDSYECTPVLTGDVSASPVRLSSQLSYFYVITKCPPSFESPLVRAYCEEASTYTANGTLPALVTDNSTGLTYANMFCAYCNGVRISRTVSWSVQTVCANETSIGLDGCKQWWIEPTDIVALAECKLPYLRSCPANASSLMQAACTDNPVKRIYDWTNRVVYRNYNCSLCYPISDPDWSCSQWTLGNVQPISAGLQALLAIYDCPSQLVTFAEADERMVWTDACPRITFDAGNCSDTLSAVALSTLYDSDPTDDYDITSKGVRVTYNSSYAACAKCRLSNHTTVATSSEYANLTRANITVEGNIYLLPFFKIFDGGYVTVCSPESFDLPTSKCTGLPSVVSQVLMALSLLGLTLYAFAYGILQSLQNLPGQIVLHQSVAFFAAFLVFMIRVPAGAVSEGACLSLGVLSHFFFLAAFTWTAVYAVEVVRALGFQAYGAGFTKRRIRYVIVGWLTPALITAAAIATDWATSNNAFRPAYGRPQCFISSQYGQLIFFTAPLALFLLIDVAIYAYVIVKLVIISGETKMVREAHQEKLFLAAKLVFALGLTWIFAVLESATSDCILAYLFELLNSLQGVFIFVIFVCNAKTSGQLRRKVKLHTSFINSAAAGSTLSVRDLSSSSSGIGISPERKSVLGVNSFSPVSLAMDARAIRSDSP